MDGTFHENREEFRVIFEELMNKNDEYFVLADYEAYCQAQSSVRDLYKDRSRWAKVCLTNIAKSGSSHQIELFNNMLTIFGI